MSALLGHQQALYAWVDWYQRQQLLSYTSNELSRKWCKAKEVNNAQAAKIYEVHLMQRTMTEVHERLGHHHERLANSRGVLIERLSHLREQPRAPSRGRKQCQAHDAGKENNVSLRLGRARRELDNER